MHKLMGSFACSEARGPDVVGGHHRDISTRTLLRDTIEGQGIGHHVQLIEKEICGGHHEMLNVGRNDDLI